MVNRIRPCVLFLLFLTGCSVVTRNAASGSFKDTIARNTKRITIERDFTVVMSMDIIRLSRQVRQAYVDEYAGTYMLSKAAKQAMLEEQKAQAKQWDAFFLIVYTSPRTYSSLNSDDPLWKLYLESDGKTLSPSSLSRMESQRELMKGFFPEINSWDEVYLVKFPRQAGEVKGSARLRFIVTGILGKGDADF